MAHKNSAETEAGQLQRRNRELTILNSIAQALNSSVDLHQALHAALAQVAELFDLRTGWVWLLDEETGAPYLAAAQNLPHLQKTYAEAIRQGYLWHEFGDLHLILPCSEI